ncbi:hypothetical protein DFH06DRAFT_1179474 [Mycena polygramma]|nr:hypothetical protein DFH06DRAFT_1179474 [Mycena polygramma]
MHYFSFSTTSLVAVLAASVLTTAAPLHRARNNNSNSSTNSNNNNNNLAQFAVACSTVGVAGNLTFQAISLLKKVQTNDQNVVAQLGAINSTLNTAFNSGETARPVCEAPDPNNLASQFATACDAINVAGTLTGTTISLLNQIQTNDQNVASQLEVLKATMNGVNTAGQVANSACVGVNTNVSDNTNNNANGNNNASNNSSNSNSNNATSSSNNNNANNNSNISSNTAKSSSSSSSTASKATETQSSSAAQNKQSN